MEVIKLKKIEKYFAKHALVGSLSNLAIGFGLGALLTHGFLDPHPVRYGLMIAGVGVLGYLYAYFSKK